MNMHAIVGQKKLDHQEWKGDKMVLGWEDMITVHCVNVENGQEL